MSNRRDFLKSASLLTAGSLLAGKTVANTLSTPSAKAKKELGLQIYSLQNELYDNLPKRMAELKEMGYINLELAGYNKGKISKVDMMEFKKAATDAGLKIVSSHVNPTIEGTPFLVDYKMELLPQVKEFWKAAAEDHAKLGCTYMIQPMMPTCKTYDDAQVICTFFNEAGKIAKEAGLTFGYHNHHMEFKRIIKPEDADKKWGFWEEPGDQIMDLFIAGTDPAFVHFEFDVYWTVRGGNDPLEYITKQSDRIVALHIKDRSVLGQSGLLNFENIFNAMYNKGIKSFFVELEKMPDGRTQFAGISDCAAYLQKASFVR